MKLYSMTRFVVVSQARDAAADEINGHSSQQGVCPAMCASRTDPLINGLVFSQQIRGMGREWNIKFELHQNFYFKIKTVAHTINLF